MIFASLIVLALSASSVPPVASKLVVQPCDFGEVYQFSTATCHVEVQNLGNVPIRLKNLRATRPGDSISLRDSVVPAHGIVLLDASVATTNEEGMSRFFFKFDTDEPGQATRTAEVRGFVDSDLDASAPSIDFGIGNSEELPQTMSLVLSSRAVEDFRVTGILEAPKYVDVTIASDRRRIDAVLKPGAPIGPNIRESIKLSVNTPHQSQVWVNLKTNIRDDVVPAGNPFAMGLMRTGSDTERKIRLSSRSGKPFEIKDITLEGIAAKVEVEPCIPQSPDCKMLNLKISPEQPTGQLGGIVKLQLSKPKRELPVYVWGMLLSPEVEVVDLNKEMEKSQKSSSEPASALSQQPDIKSALKLATRDVSEPPPAGTGPLIKWAATNEKLVFGYAVYRSGTQDGSYVRLNSDAIRVKNPDGSGSSYQWRDNSAAEGKVYWYYVGLLNRDGSKQQLSSPQKVVAK